MYITKIFDSGCPDIELRDYLNDNMISQDDIVSISFAIDSEATERFGEYSTQQILLVYKDSKR